MFDSNSGSLNTSNIEVINISENVMENFGFIYLDGSWVLIRTVCQTPVVYVAIFIDEDDMSVYGDILNSDLGSQDYDDLPIDAKKSVYDNITNLEQQLKLAGILAI